MSLKTTVCGIELQNPIIAASGTFGCGENHSYFYPASVFGGISCKAVTIKPRLGNLPPRIAETKAGMLNSIGLQNQGVDVFIEKYLPELKRGGNIVIANIAGETLEDYAAVTEKLNETNVDMLEINISCPNVKKGGASWGITTEGAAAVTKAVRAVTAKPVIMKLTPNVTDITEIAKAAESEGADAVSLINTLIGMRIDIRTKRPVLRENFGGYSGPGIFPVALRMVWQTAKAVNIDVIGIGGISSAEDVVEMMLAGAKAVQIGTAIISDPYAPKKIIEGLLNYTRDNGTENLSEIIGKVKPY